MLIVLRLRTTYSTLGTSRGLLPGTCEEYHQQYLQQHNNADGRFTLQWIVRLRYRVPLT